MKIITKIFYFLIPILTIISVYLPWTSSLWTKLQANEVIVNVISIYFILLGATLLIDLKINRDKILVELKTATTFIRQQTRSELITDSQFYQEFLFEVKKAKSVVNICYFAPYPPDATKHKDREKYYVEIKKAIKAQRNVKFRRLIRNTPKNKVWIKSIINEFKDIPNFDLALINDCPDDNIKMPHALSTQVIDNRKCWFVAIESHEKEGLYRDLYFEGHDMGQAMSGYFNRLWNLSTEIISSGQLTESGKKFQNS